MTRTGPAGGLAPFLASSGLHSKCFFFLKHSVCHYCLHVVTGFYAGQANSSSWDHIERQAANLTHNKNLKVANLPIIHVCGWDTGRTGLTAFVFFVFFYFICWTLLWFQDRRSFLLVEVVGTASSLPPWPLSPWQQAYFDSVPGWRQKAGSSSIVLDTDRPVCDLEGSLVSPAAAWNSVSKAERSHFQNQRKHLADKTSWTFMSAKPRDRAESLHLGASRLHFTGSAALDVARSGLDWKTSWEDEKFVIIGSDTLSGWRVHSIRLIQPGSHNKTVGWGEKYSSRVSGGLDLRPNFQLLLI